MFGFALFFLALCVVIFVHELGHLVAFRRVGVDVDTLAIGVAWGPHIKIKSALLRRFAGPNFTLVLSPLVLMGYVKVSDPKAEERLSGDEKALVYGGGVIGNMLFAIPVFCTILITAFINSGGNTKMLIVLLSLVLLAALLVYFARFICRWIFPVIGIGMLALVTFVLFEISGDPSLLAGGGFVQIAAQTEAASKLGNFWAYVAYLSVIIGVGNLLPLYPLDGGHIGMIHVRKFVPGFEPYFRRVGWVFVVFLLIFQFVPDLYYLFM